MNIESTTVKLNKNVSITKHCITEVFKIIEGFYIVSSITFFTLSNSGLRGHSLKLNKERYNSNIGKFSFSKRVVEHLNNLSEYVVTVNTFKNRYDRFIKNLSGVNISQ